MSTGTKFIKQTVIGGVVFLVPIVLVVLLLKRAFQMVRPPVDAIAHQIPGWQVFGLATAEILTLVLLVAFCFFAGLLATTRLARRSVQALESAVLTKVPGYELMKAAGENLVGLENNRTRNVVLARVEDSWQLGMLVEEIDEQHAAVLIPNVPSPWSGSLYIMTRDRFRHLDITVAEGIDCLKRGGLGSRELLRGKIPKFE
jgi:uncharacterized membrane protein